MSARDKEGFDFEMDNLQCLKDNGFNPLITFHNPTNFWQWKRHIGVGHDLTIEANGVTYYIEESYQDSDYSYRAQWVYQSRQPRFRDVPESDATHQRALLVNKPENFKGVSWLLDRLSILLLTMSMLLSLLRTNTPSTTTTTKTITCMPMVESVDSRQITDRPEHKNRFPHVERFPDEPRFQDRARF
jgi:hypothetical protein